MAITPAGRPAWSKTANHESYGGHLQKTNYQSQGATNPLTDITAEQHVRACEDTAAMVRTAAFAVLTVQCDDTTPGPPTITAIDMMTGVQTASYVGNNPPTGFPSGSRNGNSDVTLSFDSSYTDAYGVAEGLDLRHFLVNPVGLQPWVSVPEEVSANVIRVRTFVSHTGVAPTDAKFTLEVAA